MTSEPNAKRSPGQNGAQTGVLAVLALCSSAAFALALPTAAPLADRANSVVWVILAVALFFLLRHAVQSVGSKRGRLYFLAFGFLFSFAYVFGRYIYLYHAVKNLPLVLLTALLLTPATAAVLATAMSFFDRAANRPLAVSDGVQTGFFDKKRLFPFVFFGMLLCYIPCFLAYFPANINYDIANQTTQIISGQYTTHHPLLHTLFIRACFFIGLKLSGGYTLGFALYAVVQTLLLVAGFSYAFCCIVRLTRGQTAFHWIVLLLFALYPSNHLFAVTTTKDVLAAAAILVSLSSFSLLLFEQSKPLRKDLPRLLLFVLSSALAMLLRNGVVYAYLAFAVCILLFVRKLRLRLLLSAAISLCLFFGSSAALKSACHATDGSVVEMLAVPIQQLVNANIEHPGSFTQDEQALYDELIESNERYLPQICDPIKEFIDPNVILDHKADYWALYRSVGKKAPDSYLSAFLLLNLGLWYPDEITHSDVHGNGQGYIHTSDWFYTWDKSPITVEKHSYLPAAERLYNLFASKNIHQNIPVASMLFAPGFLCGVMFLLAILLLCRKRWRALLVFVPLLVYWASLLFAPCIYIRYVYPIIVCIPLLLALALRAYAADGAPGGVLYTAHADLRPCATGNGKGMHS